MAIEVKLKKWGNSMGIVLPKSFIEEKNLEENQKILLEVVKEANIKPIFGSLKRKMSGQKFKEFARKGWD